MAVTSLLIGQTQEFPASPQLALVIGDSLVHQGHVEQAVRWAQWIEDCADTVGDRALVAVPSLIRATLSLGQGDLAEAARDAGAAARAGRALRAAHAGRPAPSGCWPRPTPAHGSYDAAFEVGGPPVRTDRRGGPGRPGADAHHAGQPRAPAGPGVVGVRVARRRRRRRGAQGRRSAPPTPTTTRCAPRSHRRPPRSCCSGGGATSSGRCVDVVARARKAGAVRPGWSEWVSGIATDDVIGASELLGNAHDGDGRPATARGAHRAVLGSAAGRGGPGRGGPTTPPGGRHRLRTRSARPAGSRSCQREFTLLPSAEEFGEAALAAMAAESTPLPDPMATPSPATTVDYAPWEITLLGSFSVRRYGEPVSLPLSLAAQGLKIVALHEKIPVEELVELLWPDAAPGVGTRRLRNVLWRVRAASGELLERDDNFIRLAQDAMTDVGRFRQLGEEAIRRDTPPEDGGAAGPRGPAALPGRAAPGRPLRGLGRRLSRVLRSPAHPAARPPARRGRVARAPPRGPRPPRPADRRRPLRGEPLPAGGRAPRPLGQPAPGALDAGPGRADAQPISGCRRRAALPGPGPRSTRSRDSEPD